MAEFFPNEREYYVRRLPDGRVISVTPLYGDRARLHISPAMTDQWYDDGW